VTLVVDASVVVKWLLNDPVRETETEQATRLMQWVLTGGESVIQPVHWLLEVGAVLARMSPETAEGTMTMLQALKLPTDDAIALGPACRMAIDLRQHLFDTLYHALALETPETTLVTADDRYFAAAAPLGRIVRLADWIGPAE
jgi:predicted nucleic acid-binding protein